MERRSFLKAVAGIAVTAFLPKCDSLYVMSDTEIKRSIMLSPLAERWAWYNKDLPRVANVSRSLDGLRLTFDPLYCSRSAVVRGSQLLTTQGSILKVFPFPQNIYTGVGDILKVTYDVPRWPSNG